MKHYGEVGLMIQTCGGAFLGKGLCECANMPFTFNISEAASVFTMDWCKQDTVFISMVCSWRSGSWSESLQSSQPCCLTWNLQHTALLLEKKCQKEYHSTLLWDCGVHPKSHVSPKFETVTVDWHRMIPWGDQLNTQQHGSCGSGTEYTWHAPEQQRVVANLLTYLLHGAESFLRS